MNYRLFSTFISIIYIFSAHHRVNWDAVIMKLCGNIVLLEMIKSGLIWREFSIKFGFFFIEALRQFWGFPELLITQLINKLTEEKSLMHT